MQINEDQWICQHLSSCFSLPFSILFHPFQPFWRDRMGLIDTSRHMPSVQLYRPSLRSQQVWASYWTARERKGMKDEIVAIWYAKIGPIAKNPGGPKNSTHGCFSKMGYPFKKKKHRFSRDIPLKKHKFFPLKKCQWRLGKKRLIAASILLTSAEIMDQQSSANHVRCLLHIILYIYIYTYVCKISTYLHVIN